MNAARTRLTASDPRRIVLHADDLGMSRWSARGFSRFSRRSAHQRFALVQWPRRRLRLAAMGRTPRGSAFRRPSSSSLRQRLDDRGRPFDLGIHLNLTEGRPLDRPRIRRNCWTKRAVFPAFPRSSAVCAAAADGFARRWPASCRDRCSSSRPRRAADAPQRTPVHRTPAGRAGVDSPADGKFAIRVVRAAKEPSTWRLLLGRGKGVWGKVRAAAQQHYAGQFRRAMDRRGFADADAFFGTALAGQIDMRWMRRFLAGRFHWRKFASIPAWPATPKTAIGPIRLAALRPRELEMLVSADFADYLVTRGIRLGRLAELAGV